MIGISYLNSRRLEPARAHLEEALRLNPASRAAAINLAGVYYNLGDRQRATQTYDALLQDSSMPDSERAAIICNLGWQQERQGRLQVALQLYEQANALHPNHPRISRNVERVRNALAQQAAAPGSL